MSESEDLNQRILSCYSNLPRAERLLADVVLGKGRSLAAFKARDLADEANVSRATAARFFKRIGFSNFRAARHSAATGSHRPPVDIPQASKGAGGHASDGLELHLSADIQNLRHTFELVPQSLIDECVSALVEADKLWVVGFDDDFALAHYARALLIRVKPDIRFLPLGGFSVPEEFASITSQDVVFGIGMRRRPPLLKRIFSSGREAGAKLFLLTNEYSEPLPDVVTLPCHTRGAQLFDSVVAPISLVSMLCSAVAARLGQPAIERLHRIESLHKEWEATN